MTRMDGTTQPEVRQSERLSALEAVLWVDLDARIIQASEAACELLGYSRAELQALTIPDLDPDMPLKRWTRAVESLRELGSVTREATHRRKDGALLPVEITAGYIDLDGRELMCVFVRDVAAQRRHRELLAQAHAELERRVEERTGALEDSNRKLRAEIADRRRAEEQLGMLSRAVQQTTDGVAVADANGALRFVNAAWAQAHGYEADELIGQHFRVCHTRAQFADEVEPFLQRVAAAGRHQGEVGHVRRDGATFTAWMNVAVLRDELGKSIGLLVVARDLTEVKETAEELRRAHERERFLREKLTALHDLSMELSQARTADEVCRLAVELGQARLGFSRIGVWLVEPDGVAARGTFGIDESGVLRDERNRRVQTCDDCLMGQVLRGRAPVVVRGDTELFDAEAHIVGRGEHAVAALWDGRTVIGLVTTDNLLSHQPFDEQRVELLRLFAATLGHLLTRKRTEQSLQRRARFENLIAGISTDFINLPAEQIDAGVDAALRAVGEFCGAERVWVIQLDSELTSASQTHEWCAAGVFSTRGELHNVPLTQFPWFHQIALQCQPLHVPDVEALPAAAEAERERWRHEGYRSLIAAPMVAAGGLFGYVGFGALTERRDWGAETTTLLTVVGQMLVNALDRKRAEEALVESEERYRLLVENVADGVAVVLDGRIAYASPALGRILSRPTHEIVGQPTEAFFALQDRARLRARVAQLASGAQLTPTTYRFCRPDGSQVLVELSSRMIARDGRPAILTVIRDVSERERALRALRRSEERYRGLVESQRDLIVRRDTDGSLTFANDAYCNFFGRTRAQLIGAPHEPLTHPDDVAAAAAAFQRLQQPPHRTAHEQRVQTAEGWRWLSWEHYAIQDDQGQIVEVQGVGRDTTELRRAEEKARRHLNELAHITRLNTMGEMATSLAHELNQPLSAVSNYLGSAMRRARQDDPNMPELLEDLAAAVAQTRRAGEFVRRIKEFIRKQEPQPSTLDINQTVTQAAELTRDLFERHAVQLELQLGEDLPAVFADNIQLQQVLINLLCNAVEAQDESPSGQPPRVCVTTRRTDAAQLTVCVEDNGPGFDAARLPQIFDPFHTTKRGGTGLGLSISRSIIRAHGGELEAAARSPRGARFSFTLPTQSKEPSR